MDMRSLVFAMQVHGLVVKLLNGDLKDTVFVQNSLIDVHSKLGNLADVEKIFNGLMFKDLSSWNIIMDAYARRRFIDKALKVFKSMSEKDTLSYNIMKSGLAESGYGIEALELFLQLLHSQSPRIKPNMSTYTTVLTVCATFTMLEFGVQIHGLLRKNSKYWIVRMDKPSVEVVTKAQMVDHYAQVLTKVLGNAKDAQMCIYHISWQNNFGFCCELDEECAQELAGVPGVLSVQQDENFGS
ncbi:hypothetical protein IFM89_030491 [Coptis chinensis]|uniref:MORF/ORRM1/DAG-like MORF domain-containing protein n=1 Tax=Coptis chinensis TaxID=261450 RepID=A0A835H9W1_9MAGN|nr:hypothetical protein IFM89_030491 [Coptis chinensis]